MDAERLARYHAKLTHASERLALFQEWVPSAAEEVRDRLACYKAIQEVAEALLDAVAMLVRDKGGLPKDDYSNLDWAEEHGVLEGPTVAGLRELNGLRNRLVHEYNGLWDDVAIESASGLAPAAETAIREVKACITTD